MKDALKKAIEQKKDLQVQNDTNGEVIAIVKDGDNKLERLLTALQEEFCTDDFSIEDVTDSKNDGIKFEFIDHEQDGKHFIQLLNAFIY